MTIPEVSMAFAVNSYKGNFKCGQANLICSPLFKCDCTQTLPEKEVTFLSIQNVFINFAIQERKNIFSPRYSVKLEEHLKGENLEYTNNLQGAPRLILMSAP